MLQLVSHPLGKGGGDGGAHGAQIIRRAWHSRRSQCGDGNNVHRAGMNAQAAVGMIFSVPIDRDGNARRAGLHGQIEWAFLEGQERRR